ncbi:MAG: TIGR02206 family membrane protein [Erysipelotrichaceae bacterium]|nr:TIGR02206 family membrane protein [Erysipelotrichaceae bacterium]
MSGEYPYSSEGFFGFGEPGIFRAYGLMHLIPVLIFFAAVVFISRRREQIRNWKHETSFRYGLSFFMFVIEFSYFIWLLYVGDTSGQYLMMSKLPLHLCDLGMICCMYTVITKNQVLFGFNFFVTLFGASLACIIPQTVLSDVSPAYFRYYQFWFEHLVPIFGTVYMMVIHDMRPRYRDLWITSAFLISLLYPSIRLNEAFPGSDYLFLKLDTSLFPADQYIRAAVYTVAIIGIFHLMYLLCRLVTRQETAVSTETVIC